MARRFALGFLGISSALILGLSFWGHPVAGVGFAVLAMAFPVSLMILGVARGPRLGAIRFPILILLVLLETALLGMLHFRGSGIDGTTFLGLPPAAGWQIFGVFLAPLAVVALGYAWTFDAFGVSDEDLKTLRTLSRKPPAE